MNATPKRYLDHGVRTIPTTTGLWLECEITNPKSAKGRNVDVFIPNDMIVGLLKELRTVAIMARSAPIGET